MAKSPRPPPRQTALDLWFERMLGDSHPQHFGSGWLAGLAGVVLGAGSFFAVIVFQFPEWTTMADLRGRYPVDTMRGLLTLAIVAAFFCSALNILLRPSKKLGLAGLAFTIAAVILGGAGVEIEPGRTAPVNIGLDWLVLNIVLLSFIFVPLERLFPLKPDQGIFRAGWSTDGIYFIVSHVAVELLTFFTLLPATLVSQAWQARTLSAQIAELPLLVQVFLVMLVADLAQYWVHRAFHRIGWAWPFHAIHHSTREMDWLAGSRLHVVDIVVTRALILLPLFILGFSETALFIWLAIVATQATFNHVNMRFRMRWIEQVLVTPRFHHWHHAMEPIDKNFAVHFPWIDRIFGTYYLPEDRWPNELGIHGDPVPDEFERQLVYPFQRRNRNAAGE